MKRSTSNFRRLLNALLVAMIVVIHTSVLLAAEAEDEDAETLKDAHFAKDRIAALIKQLDAPIVEERIQAIEKLCIVGPEARAAVPKLIELLSDDAYFMEFGAFRNVVSDKASRALTAIGSEAVHPLSLKFGMLPASAQRQAVFTARQIGPKARALLPQFVKTFGTQEKGDPSGLLDAIAAIDPDGKSAIPILIKALRDDADEWVRRNAATWLTRSEALEIVYWDETAPATRWFRHSPRDLSAVEAALLAALADKSEEVRGPAAITLSTYPAAAQRAVPLLIALLDDKESYSVAYSNHVGGSESIASAAAEALSRMPSQADRILPALIKSMSENQQPSAEDFAQLIPHSTKPLEHLTILLDGAHPKVALVTVARLGPAARPLIPKLEALQKREEASVAAQANMALACIDPVGHPKALELAQRLVSYDLDESCGFLRMVGPNAAFAVPMLEKQMPDKETEGELNWTVVRTLQAIGPLAATVAPQVIDRLDTGYSFYTNDKEDALYYFGPAVVPLLIEALKNPAKSPRHRISCLHVLGRLGSKSAEAVPVIVAQLGSNYPRVREAAATALGLIASRPAEALPGLQRMLSDPRPFVRAAATQSCGAFGAEAQPIVPALVKQLADEYLDVRIAAASALGHLKAVANEAVPRLKELQDAEDVLLRDTVHDALDEIGAN